MQFSIIVLSVFGSLPFVLPLSIVLFHKRKPEFFPPSRLKMPLLLTTTAGIVAGTFMIHLVTWEFFGTLFLAGLALSPFWVTWMLGFFCESKWSQRLLMISTVVHSLWFAFLYREVFHRLLEPETAFMIAAFYSLPVMLPLWIVAFLKRTAITTAI